MHFDMKFIRLDLKAQRASPFQRVFGRASKDMDMASLFMYIYYNALFDIVLLIIGCYDRLEGCSDILNYWCYNKYIAENCCSSCKSFETGDKGNTFQFMLINYRSVIVTICA